MLAPVQRAINWCFDALQLSAMIGQLAYCLVSVRLTDTRGINFTQHGIQHASVLPYTVLLL